MVIEWWMLKMERPHMNERIKLLAEQAEQHAHEQNDKHGIRFKSEYNRKFAELIVAECIEQVWYTREDSINDNISNNLFTC